jgi:hypothetical protein
MKTNIPINGSVNSCQNCKDPFITKRKDKKYCTNSCKQKAYIKRKISKSCTQISWIKIKVVAVKKEGFLKRFFKRFW